uniref:Mobile element protein n=1 Tax=Nonomuraea gerenzanensis TaxID=93944 RepID=A0A1M4EJW7_9ACTN|nr:Mobile element protein [Nonomuraea gerenzanensis]
MEQGGTARTTDGAPTGRVSLSAGRRADLHRRPGARESGDPRAGPCAVTISREIRRNRHPTGGQYRPHAAQARADARRPRPKPSKIDQNPELRACIQKHLHKRWSPEQIVRSLRRTFPERAEMHVCHEAIYSTPMVMISERPAEADDRAVPGHWEGHCIIGKNGSSAIGTLVERTTRYVMLVRLPIDRSAERMRDALLDTVATLPAYLKRSLTWDQGSEMGRHHEFSVAADMPVYFCDPAGPWPRGSNETRTACCASTSPRAPTCQSTPATSSMPSPPNLTPDHERRSTGKLQPSVSPCCWPSTAHEIPGNPPEYEVTPLFLAVCIALGGCRSTSPPA